MYSASINCIFSSDESDNIEIEVSMRDSDGKDLSAYAAGDDITAVLGDIADQLEEGFAETEKPELTEAEKLAQKIEELSAQLDEMTARNQYLENALTRVYEDQTPKNNEPQKKYDNVISVKNSKKDYSSLLDRLNKFSTSDLWDIFA